MGGGLDAKEDRMRTRSRRDRWQPGGEFPTGQVGDRLVAVLAAAAAPAHPGELAGEEAAVVAFRAAHTETVAGRGSSLRSVLAKVLTIKAVIVVAVAGSAGVVAATVGMLPSPWSPAAPAEQSSTSASAPTPTERSAAAGTAPTRPDTTVNDLSVMGPSADALCQELAARGRSAKALKNPRFQPLVEAAGSEDKVAGYCTPRLRQSSKATNKSGSDDHGKPEHAGEPENAGKPASESADESPKTGRNGAATATPQPNTTGNSRDAGGVDTPRRSAPPSARPSTPGSPAHGAAKSPETPGGAGPPSQGG